MRPSPLPRRRLRIELSIAVLSLLAGLLTVLVAPASAGQGWQGSSRGQRPDAVHPKTTTDDRAADEVAPRPDFPSLPARCFAKGQGTPLPQACYVTRYDRTRPTVVVWGDSHAWQYMPAMRQSVAGRPVNLVSFVSGGCPPARVGPPPEGTRYRRCEANDLAAITWLRRQVRNQLDVRLVLSAHWSGYRRAYRRMFLDEYAEVSGYDEMAQRSIRLFHAGIEPLFEELARLKLPTDVIGPSGTYPEVKLPCPAGEDPYRCDLPRARVLPEEGATKRWLEEMIAPLSGGARLIDTTGYYCDTFICHGRVGTVNTFFDHLHLSGELTGTMTSSITPSIDRLVRDSRR